MAIYTYFGNGNGFGASYGQGAAAFPHPLPAGRWRGEKAREENRLGVVCSGTLGWDDQQGPVRPCETFWGFPEVDL